MNAGPVESEIEQETQAASELAELMAELEKRGVLA
jgi:hypothetical protein